jgi:AraC-like DNA-binding protein
MRYKESESDRSKPIVSEAVSDTGTASEARASGQEPGDDKVTPAARSHALAGRPAIRAFFTEPVLAALRARKIPVSPLLRRAGLSRAELSSPYAWIPLAGYLQLFDHAADATEEPSLGLHLGQAFRLAMLGPFGPLVQQSGTLGAALELFARFQQVWQTGTTFAIGKHDGLARLIYRIDGPRIGPQKQDAEFTLAALVGLVKALVGSEWRPLAVGFQHSEGKGAEAARSMFRAPVAFGSTENWIAVDLGVLDHPLPGGLAGEHTEILERHLLDLLGAQVRPAPDFVAAARAIIDRQLGGDGLSADAVAQELHLSVRSLRRRLAEGGTSFRDLLQDRRRLRAEALLLAGTQPLARIAQQLGYADAAVLSRAFRDWTGVPPHRFAPRPGRRDNT